MKDKSDQDLDNLVVDEMLMLLQEKRTALKMIRIGLATLVAQISILAVLMAAAKFINWMHVLHLLIPFILLNLAVLVLAGYFIFVPLIQIGRLDREIILCKDKRRAFSGSAAEDRNAAPHVT